MSSDEKPSKNEVSTVEPYRAKPGDPNAVWSMVIQFGGAILGLFMGMNYLMYKIHWTLPLFMLSWCYFDPGPFNGGSGAYTFMRDNFFYRWVGSYFPSHLHIDKEEFKDEGYEKEGKEEEEEEQEEEEAKGSFLDSKTPHLFIVHPHGLIGAGTWLTFALDDNHFQRDYNFDIRIATVRFNFLIPFWSALFQSYGFVDASFKSLKKVLSLGRSLTIVLGGATESQYAYNHSCNIILEKRKGFIRLALETGCYLVPNWSFGDNELYDLMKTKEGSFLHTMQHWFLKTFKFYPPIFMGKWIFLPKSHYLNMVMGNAFYVPKKENYTDEDVAFYHAKYKRALMDLYERYQPIYGDCIHEEMKIVA